MFINRYYKTLDQKGRVVIPSEVREELGSPLYAMKGYEGSIAIYREKEFERLAEEAETLPFNKKDVRLYLRLRLSSTCRLELDSLGRIQLPAALLARYNIGREIVLLGIGNHLEIWDRQAFDKYEEESESVFDETAERIKNYKDEQ